MTTAKLQVGDRKVKGKKKKGGRGGGGREKKRKGNDSSHASQYSGNHRLRDG